MTKLIRVLLLLVLLVIVLYYGKPFLVPVVFAMLLSMLLLPISDKLVKRGWNKALAILVSIFVFLGFFALIITVLTLQVQDLAKDAPAIEQNVMNAISKIKQKITGTLGLPAGQQQGIQPSALSSTLTKLLSSAGGFIAHFVLMLVYIFLFLYYRSHLKNFILRLVPEEEKQNTRIIIDSSRKVAQKYLTGLSMMIVCLWIMYGIGFTIIGIKNPLFFALLCGTLEIVPFVGNLVGSLLTAGFNVAQGGGLSVAVGVLITYGIVQFVQTYLLEPLVVGRGVNINPLFTIAGLVAGEIIWGIPGMVLAIPVLGITKIICDHVEKLKPIGQLIGDQQPQEKRGRFFKWIKKKLGKKS